ncbi:hypothetical protein [Pyxidicoccus caerfyrddinensis]|uniref:hypothetical protein n=1 Tax=Pyxidicoccus caerfyrddinensis TaxID=2709663 RepID=UPI0013DC2A47|nr:hypothetical protein [Pyxidicoccus caerfyrddinensis]
MADALRPHIATAAAAIADVAAFGDGYALLTSEGIELLDGVLAKRGVIAGKSDHVLRVLPDERFLVHGSRGSWLYEGKVGGALEKVDFDGLVYSVAFTEGGYLALGTKAILVDRAGVRTVVPFEERLDHGGVAWKGGVAIAGYGGLAILDAEAAVIAQSVDERLWKAPVALADAIAVPAHDDVVLFDGEARVIGRIPRKVSDDGLVACGDGVLVRVYDDDTRRTEVSYWERCEERWSRTFAEHMQPPVVVGSWVVIASYETGAWIFNSAGQELAQLETSRFVQEVAAFGGGIALTVRDDADALWWRPDTELVRLGHDVWPHPMRGVPAGLATVENNILYVWRTDVQGPESTAVESDLPMNVPIVINGTPVRIVAAGRFALRGETLRGKQAWRIARGSAWRPLTTREEALRIVECLVQRTFDGPLPATDELAQLPLAQTVDLHGRALFAASTLDPDVRAKSAWSRGAFFDELGAALGTSGRAVLAAVKARKVALVPPRPVPDYEYLGTFAASGELTISDPCYVGRKESSRFPMSLKVVGHEGIWHVFIRSEGDRTAELVTIHDDGFDTFATEPAGVFSVDSGTAGVFDKKCPKRDSDAPLEEGTFAALGAISSTGWGDGMYPAYVGSLEGRVAKIRLYFVGDEPEVDRSVPKKAAGAAKPYSASAKFALGDTIEHVKFGTGSVIRVGDSKIDVRFSDATRTLVHAR